MPEIVTCATCATRKDANDIIQVNNRAYCDKYCLYVDDPNTPYVSVPQEAREAFAKLAGAKAALRAAQAQIKLAGV